MNRTISLKIASIIFFIYGCFELFGTLMLLLVTSEHLKFLSIDMIENKIFWAGMCGIFGISRIIAGYAMWMRKKWGIAFGLIISVVTMIAAPSIYPFGITDALFSIITLPLIFFSLFGDERLSFK